MTCTEVKLQIMMILTSMKATEYDPFFFFFSKACTHSQVGQYIVYNRGLI